MYGDNTSQSPSARGIRTVKNVGNWKDRRIGRRKENRERKKRGRKIFDFYILTVADSFDIVQAGQTEQTERQTKVTIDQWCLQIHRVMRSITE